jgi:hypothetical protein
MNTSPITGYTARDQAADWLRRRARLRIHSAVGDLVMAEGTVVAWCAAPSFTIEHDDGTRSTWSADLPIVEVEKLRAELGRLRASTPRRGHWDVSTSGHPMGDRRA